MAWYQISLISDERNAPQIADFLSDLGALSVTYLDAEDQPVYEPPLNSVKIWQRTKILALFELDARPAAIQAQFLQQFSAVPQEKWQIEILEDEDWERRWLEYYQPMCFGQRLWVCPTGMERHEPGCVCLALDPGLAFGTGTHPTTALCLEWLAGQDLQDKTIIDYGCGSGILAVAAVLLGANRAYAIDIDPQAITATRMNAEKNQVSERVVALLPEQFETQQADVVLANILAVPLILMAPHLSALVSKGGALILSGILNEQADSVLEAYAPSFHFGMPQIQEDWCRLDGSKPKD